MDVEEPPKSTDFFILRRSDFNKNLIYFQIESCEIEHNNQLQMTLSTRAVAGELNEVMPELFEESTDDSSLEKCYFATPRIYQTLLKYEPKLKGQPVTLTHETEPCSFDYFLLELPNKKAYKSAQKAIPGDLQWGTMAFSPTGAPELALYKNAKQPWLASYLVISGRIAEDLRKLEPQGIQFSPLKLTPGAGGMTEDVKAFGKLFEKTDKS